MPYEVPPWDLPVAYLHIDENAGRFGWAVRVLSRDTPLERGSKRFASVDAARAAGRAALTRYAQSFFSSALSPVST